MLKRHFFIFLQIRDVLSRLSSFYPANVTIFSDVVYFYGEQNMIHLIFTRVRMKSALFLLFPHTI